MRRTLAVLLFLFPLALHAAAPPTSDLPKGARQRIGSPRLRHGGPIRWLAFSPDGKMLASASDDRTVSVWDVPTGHERHRFYGHLGAVTCLAFAPDGETLVSADGNGLLCAWALTGAKTGLRTAQYQTKGDDSVESLAFRPDGKRLAVGCVSGLLLLLEPQLKPSSERSHDQAIRAMVWSGDGKWIATSAGNQIRLCHADGAFERSFGTEAMQCLVFAGDELVSWEAGGTLRVWDISTGKQLRQWTDSKADPSALLQQIAPTADGKSVFVGSHDAADEWETATGKHPRRLPGLHLGRVTACAVGGDVLATAGTDNAIRLHDLKTGKSLTPPAELAPVTALYSFDKGGIAALTNTLHFWDATGKATLGPVMEKPLSVAHHPGTPLWFLDPKGRLSTSDVAKKSTRTIDKDDQLQSLALSADGKLIAGAMRNGSLRFYDGSGKFLRAGAGRERGAVPVLSPDGAILAMIGKAANVDLFDTKTGDERPGLTGHNGGTLAAMFSPDGRLLVSGGRDRNVRLWELASRRERVKTIAHSDWVRTVAFRPDGRLVASGTTTGRVTVIDTRTGRVAAEFAAHRGPVTGLLFTDNDSLASAGLDGSILIWDIKRLKLSTPDAKVLTTDERKKHWEAMADDALTARLASLELGRDREFTVKFLAEAINPIDAKQVTQWIADLSDEAFAVRENATKQLRALGVSVEAALRTALENKPDLEKSRRIKDLLELLKRAPNGEYLRSLRAVELLEEIGNESAVTKLRELAGGLADAELTRQAKAALGRLR